MPPEAPMNPPAPQQQASAPMTEPSHTPPPLPQKKHSGSGPVIGIIIIVVLLAFGALYFWGAHLNKQTSPEPLPFIPGDTAQ